MTYEEIVGKVVVMYKQSDVSEIQGHLALQFNVTGEGEGAFYLEVDNGKVDIQPYEYYDNDAIITIGSDTLIAILDGKLSLEDAFNGNLLWVNGDFGAALMFKKIKPKKKKSK